MICDPCSIVATIVPTIPTTAVTRAFAATPSAAVGPTIVATIVPTIPTTAVLRVLRVISTKRSVQWQVQSSVPSAQSSVLSPQCSVLSAQCSVLSAQCSVQPSTFNPQPSNPQTLKPVTLTVKPSTSVYHANQWVLSLIVAFTIGLGTTLAFGLPDALLADIIDYDELRTGDRNEGVYTVVETNLQQSVEIAGK